MKPIITTLCLSALLAASTSIRAGVETPESKVDDSVKEALLTAGVGYQNDEDGNFHLNVKFKSGRHQKVIVFSKTIQLALEPEGDEMREVYSVAFVTSQAPSGELSARLLQANATAKIGGWVVRKIGEKFEVGFRGFIPADVCEDELLPVVSLVASHADGLEDKETQRDEN
jgi:hypothetical protein